VLEDLRMGRLAIRTTDTDSRDASDRLGRRIFSALVASACLLAGALLLTQGHGALGKVLMALALVGSVLHWMADIYRQPRARR
jgi:hypothetical protein